LLSIYYVVNSSKLFQKIIGSIVAMWLAYFLIQSQSLSGYSTLVLAFSFVLIKKIVFFKSKLKRYLGISFVLLSIFVSFFMIARFYNFLNSTPIEKQVVGYTVNGNIYLNYTGRKDKEGENFIYMNLCDYEIRKEWSSVSHLDVDSVYSILVRYLTATNRNKDSVGVHSLSENDIKNIESGIANPSYLDHGIKAIYSKYIFIMSSYFSSGNPNNNSFMQRLVYSKAAINLIKDNWLFGVGISNSQPLYNEYYNVNIPELGEKNRNRAHNQFLSLWLEGGLVCLFAFSLLLILAFHNSFLSTYWIKLALLVILTTTFFIEDTIETQIGSTFFGLVLSIVIFPRK
jgi:hypothetical protein